MPREYEKLWPDCKVKHLVLSDERFIVFLDDQLDLDWSTSKQYEGVKDQQKHNEIVNNVALLEATPCDGLSETTKTQFRRLLGEALARSFDHDYRGAKSMLQYASGFIAARSRETSRWWYLSASGTMTAPFILGGAGLWIFRSTLIPALGASAFWLSMSASAGAVGACLSVILRTGRQTFDCSAGRPLHYLEGGSRIWAGAFSGVIAGLAVWSGLIFATLANGSRLYAIVLLAGFAAGTGERLATSIISNMTPTGVESPELGEATSEAPN